MKSKTVASAAVLCQLPTRVSTAYIQQKVQLLVHNNNNNNNNNNKINTLVKSK